MLRDFGDRENTRVRDLVDLVILMEHDLLVADKLAAATKRVWAERDGAKQPTLLPSLPESWPARYEQLAAAQAFYTRNFPAAVALVARLWAEMFSTAET